MGVKVSYWIFILQLLNNKIVPNFWNSEKYNSVFYDSEFYDSEYYDSEFYDSEFYDS